MSLNSVMARISEIQGRFGVTSSLGSATVDVGDFSGMSIDELIEVATEATEEVAGHSVARTVEASLLDALNVQRGDAGLLDVGSLSGVATPPPLPHHYAGSVTFPVAGYEIGSAFGPRVDPIDGDQRMHRGVDVGAPTGTPILAAAAGEITYAGPRGTYGNLVIIQHDDHTETRYAHQHDVSVAVGDRVDTGDVIGTVGSTGRSTGPHLHFETRVDGVAIDPVIWLREHS